MDFLVEHMPEVDRESLDLELLEENIGYAYKVWKDAPWGASITEERFLNDVLPYASINERRDRWRKDFYERLMPLVAEAGSASEATAILNREIFALFDVKYSTARPKADQSPYESMDAKLASCTGLSVLLVDACRAVGVPARLAGTPLWADGSGNHTWVEIWDGEWRFTGAAEPTGDALDKGWFSDRAAQAVAGDPQRAVFATSWRGTGRHFPMVWKPESVEVPGIDVTARYAQEASVEPGFARLRIIVLDKAGERFAAGVAVMIDGEDVPLLDGMSHDGSYDANDHLTAVVPLGVPVAVKLLGKHQLATFKRSIYEDETRLTWAEHAGPGNANFESPAEWLWREHAERIRVERAAEMKSKKLVIGDQEMRFDYTVFGDKPEGGRSLYISMHGGGGAPTKVNDQQWENQKRLYEPAEGVYVAPRAPTDTWNLWHQGHIDALFDRLIENMVVFEDVDPTKVYLMGYSAGGDGVYQLAPRMADRFAAAAMMAGHPNETKPDGLRNLPFTLHMGGDDAAYDRNKIAAQWKEQLAALQEADPEGYEHWVEIYEGKGHWMDREDAAALPWMAKHSLDRRPKKIVWLQDDVLHPSFYWLHVDKPIARSRVVVERDGNTFRILEASGLAALTLRMDRHMVDYTQEVSVVQGDKLLFQGKLQPSADVARRTLAERGVPTAIWDAEVRVDLE